MYPGVHLVHQLTWHTLAQTVHKHASACLGQLFPLLVSSAMTQTLGKMIVHAHLLSVIRYVWENLAKVHKNKLQSVLDRGPWVVAKGPIESLLTC